MVTVLLRVQLVESRECRLELGWPEARRRERQAELVTLADVARIRCALECRRRRIDIVGLLTVRAA